jgi:hypothetical protein
MSAIGERESRGSIRLSRRPAQRLEFRWVIDPAAAVRAGLCESGAGLVELILCVDVCGAEATAGIRPVRAVLRVGARERSLEWPAGRCACAADRASGLVHVDIEGWLNATVRGEGEVLYARTPLLARLGLPGGRYEGEGSASRE